MLKRIGLSLIMLICIGFAAFAQTGTIKGFVYDRANGEPMIFVNVVLQGSNFVVQTDVNGYFSIPQVPEGTYTLTTTIVGYDTARSSITITPNVIVSKKLYIGRRDQTLKEVQVSARKVEKTTQVNAGVTSITPREMKLLPSTGGEPDIAQYLQVVPGVVFTGDQGGQLFIRGGSPTQTGILLDGITIYNPFHSIGLYSVFETDAIRNADVYSAGFNAQYGNRTSAILDVRTKDGNKNRLSGKLSGSPIMARAMLEGPLTKAKTEGGSNLTFLASLKHSYLDKTSKPLYSGFGDQFAGGLPYSFTDMYGKVTLNTESGSKFNLFGFNFNDQAKALHPITHNERASFQWNTWGAGTTFIVTPNSSSSLINGKFAYSKYLIDYTEANYIPTNATAGNGKRSSGIDGFEGAIDFTYYLPGYSQLKYGVEVSGLHTTLDYFDADGTRSTLERRNTSAAGFAMFRKNFNSRFLFEPGLRVQYYSAVSTLSLEPRIGLKYNISNSVRLKAASGLYSQNIISTKSDRDIVNFFTGFVLSPDQTIYNTNLDPLKNNLQRAFHLMGGLEVDVRDVEFNLEPWFKFFNPNIELSRIKVNIADPDFVAGKGTAAGIDLSARYNKNRWYIWGVVSYQKITYETLVLENNVITNSGAALVSQPVLQSYPPPFDRRINTNLLIAYTAGKKKDWELSTRYNLGSPFPFTQTQGFYEQVNVLQNGLNTNPNTLNGQIGLIYANDINGGRLSYYHRWDVSARKRFTLSQYSNIETTLSVGNVLSRNNIFYIDRLENVRVYQLPIFPSLNVTWNF